jgi:hypothetical protein
MHPPRHRFQREEPMARSHQRGTVRLEHKSWVGYLNLKVLDPDADYAQLTLVSLPPLLTGPIPIRPISIGQNSLHLYGVISKMTPP